jgi:hypothetical protein
LKEHHVQNGPPASSIHQIQSNSRNDITMSIHPASGFVFRPGEVTGRPAARRPRTKRMLTALVRKAISYNLRNKKK